MKRFLIALLALATLMLVGCGGEDLTVETKINYTVYENGESEMISFYLTSDVKPYGVWEYSLDGSNFEIFDEIESEKKYGGVGEKASYITLILKPTSEGESKIDFSLADGDITKSYKLTVKETDGILKITVEELL